MALDGLLSLASRFSYLGHGVFDVFPLLSLFPRALAFVPWPAGILAGGHVEVCMGKPQVALQDSRWKIRLDGGKRRTELLEMCDFPCHQETQGVLHMGIVCELQQSLVNDLGARFCADIRS
jgi:hypothetical protein